MKPFFSGSFLNRLSDQRSGNLWNIFANSKNLFLLFNNLNPLFNNGVPVYASKEHLDKHIPNFRLEDNSPIFLGLEKSVAYWALDVSSFSHQQTLTGTWQEVRNGLPLSQSDASILGHARSLIAWNSDHLFCSKCGGKTVVIDWGHKKECLSCKTVSYPRMDPVVIALVLNEARNACLLGRNVRHPPGLYSCLAGFLEHGESVEDAVIREVYEESNIK